MKRLFAWLLAIIYLFSSIGATMRLHYCMGRLVEWKFGESTSSTCSRCGMKKKPGSASGCCKDEYRQIKVEKAQKPTENYFQFPETITAITHINSAYSILFSPVSTANFAKINAPPPHYNSSLNVLHCVYRI